MKTTISAFALLATMACSSSGEDVVGPQVPSPGMEPADPPSAAPEVCAEANESFADVTPTIVVVIDRSGSMTETFGATTRWNAVYDTLMDEDSGVIRRLEDEVRFGVLLYNSENGFEGGTCPMLESVAPSLRNADAIDEVYAPLGPSQDTPTGPAMLAAAELVAGEPSPTFLVLATDGLPDTCDVPDPDGRAEARAEAVSATQTAFAGGAATYVLSVGPDVAEDHLQEMANAGAGLDPDGEIGAPFYVALQPEVLVEAFEDIVNDVRFCTYTFDEVELATREEGYVFVGVRVTLDGLLLEEGSDWRLVGGDTVQLLGASCDEVLDGGDHEVTAELLCEMRLR